MFFGISPFLIYHCCRGYSIFGRGYLSCWIPQIWLDILSVSLGRSKTVKFAARHTQNCDSLQINGFSDVELLERLIRSRDLRLWKLIFRGNICSLNLMGINTRITLDERGFWKIHPSRVFEEAQVDERECSLT